MFDLLMNKQLIFGFVGGLGLFLFGMESNKISGLMVKSEEMEEQVGPLARTRRNNHIARLNTGDCTVLSGRVFIDILHNLEKIGDHTLYIAEAIVGEK